METTKTLVPELISAITVDARNRTTSGNNGDWTHAIWDSLEAFAKKRKLALYPEKGPYKGEYHLDFTIWQDGYGPLVGIECQWLHWRQKDPLNCFRWAFDKLQGVKCDLKILIFDWKGLNSKRLPREVEKELHTSMCKYQMNLLSEHYLLIWFSWSEFEVFEWKPLRTGKHSPEEVIFSPWNK
jgi:hypothetical protein